MGKSDDFVATFKVTNDGQTATSTSNPLNVYINTNAKISSVVKGPNGYPSRHSSWQSSWGTAPANANDYYYLVWTIKTTVAEPVTQPYNFTLQDALQTANGEVIGYKFSGQSTYSMNNTVTNQTSSGYRYDYVLTRHPKSYWQPLEHWSIKNSVTAIVDPIDQVDADTKASASQTYVWNKPVFTIPSGHFNSYKRADGNWRACDLQRKNGSYGCTLTYLTEFGMKAGEYSRYDLDEFQDGTITELSNLDYAVWMRGYPYPWTYQANSSLGPKDPNNYGILKVKFELIDEGVYLYDEVAGVNENLQLDYNDFEIDTIAYSIRNSHVTGFNEETQSYITSSNIFDNNDILNFYGKFANGDWVKIASYTPLDKTTWFDSNYVESMTNSLITLKDNCVAYKVDTTNSHYYTEVNTVPNMHLKNSTKVMSFARNKQSIGIHNKQTANFYRQDGTKILTTDEADSNFARVTQKDSYIFKDSVAATNNVKKKYYAISWKIGMTEQYIAGESNIDYINQNSGVFYDLLPKGAILDVNSVSVRAGTSSRYSNAVDTAEKMKNRVGQFLPSTAFTVEQIPDYKGTGRTLLIVRIKEEAKYYDVFFDTIHSWDSISDWGNDVYNPVAYETGNDKIKYGTNNDGGNIDEKDLMANLPSDAQGEKFIYAQSYFDIATITAASTGLTKKVKTLDDKDFSYETITTNDGNYEYRWRIASSHTSKTKNIILFDSMENYVVEGKVSDWHGTIQSIDLSQPKSMGINPILYYSTIENLDIENNHDITDSSVWQRLTDQTDLSTVKALAADLRKTTSGADFVLNEGESLSIILHMKAPHGAESQGTYPEAYNNIYLQDTVIGLAGTPQDFFIHQDYTTVRFVITEDLTLKKVSSEDNTTPLKDLKFRLRGTSDYGTEEDRIVATDNTGTIVFKDIEKGSYILSEYESTKDWLLNPAEFTVSVNAEGVLSITGQENSNFLDFTYNNGIYTLTVKDDPRVHGDLTILKRREGGSEDISNEKELLWKYVHSNEELGYNPDIFISDSYGDDAKNKTGMDVEDYHEFLCSAGRPLLNQNSPVFSGNIGDIFRKIRNKEIDIFFKYNNHEFISVNVQDNTIWFASVDTANTFDSSDEWFHDGSGLEIIEFNSVRTPESNYTEYLLDENGDIQWGVYKIWLTNTGKNISISDNFELYEKESTNIKSRVVNQELASAEIGTGIEYNDKYYSVIDKNDTKILLNEYKLIFNHSITNIDGDKIYFDSSSAVDELLTLHSKYKTPTGYSDVKAKYNNVDCSIRFEDNPPKYAFFKVSGHVGATPWMTLNTGSEYAKGFLPLIDEFNVGDNIIIYEKKQDTSDAIWVEHTVKFTPNIKPQTPISDTKFKLYGTSDYGNDVMEIGTTNAAGRLTFNNIELGTYTLEEIVPNSDYILNTTKWTVKVDEQGNVSIVEPEDETLRDRLYTVERVGNNYVIFNEPRYWNFTLRKIDKENETIWLEGAEFTLTGISELGTEYNEVVESNENGRVVFNRIEKGTYILKETKAPTGVTETGAQGGNRNYIADPKEYIVKIDNQGNVTINGLNMNQYDDFVVKNDRAYDGKITIVKKWEDNLTNDERPEPVVHLSTNEPNWKRGITVTKVWEGDSPEDRPEDITVHLGTNENAYFIADFSEGIGEVVTVDVERWFIRYTRRTSSKVHLIDKNGDIHELVDVYSINQLLESPFGDEDINIEDFNIEENYKIILDDYIYTGKTYDIISKKYDANTPVIPGLSEEKTDDYVHYFVSDEQLDAEPVSNYTNEDINTKNIIETSTPNSWTKNTDNTWTYTFDILLEDENANKEFYIWEEPIEGYTTENDESNPILVENQAATITNTKPWSAKYAVSLMDIGVDVNQEGKRMGLAFGPATGDDANKTWTKDEATDAGYVNAYKSHTPTGNTANGNAHRCLHDDDWNTIIHWNNTDPYVYEQCISENCTHSVELHEAGETILNPQFEGVSTGDGPSQLYYELLQYNGSTIVYENVRWHPNNNMPNNTANHGTTYGGWGSSRIRAMLNGADSLTDLGDGTAAKEGGTDIYASGASSDVHKSANIYTSTNNLLTTFPQELQNAIGKRATKYDSVYNSKTKTNLKTTYDKLWLLSPNEIWSTSQNSSTYYAHPLEGVQYERFVNGNSGVTSSITNVLFNRTFRFASNTAAVGSDGGWWLRSSSGSSAYRVTNVGSYGSVGNSSAIYNIGVSPCFSLDTDYKFYTTKYAVQIYGIGQDTLQDGSTAGLTFGPALGQDFMNTYISHTPSGLTDGSMATDGQSHEHRCIHNDNWETIVYWNKLDPAVYEQCIAENCTHSVNLTLSDTLKNPNFIYGGSPSGDGVGTLQYELIQNNNYQHLEWNPLQSSNSTSYGTSEGGWGASRIRAMMNGADSLTTTGTNYGTGATGNYLPTMAATDYTGSDTLLSAFPQILQDNIGARKTLYDSVFNSKTTANLKTSYDKLWLLSSYEMTDSISASTYQHPLEAPNGKYQKFVENNINISTTSNTAFIAYYQNNNRGASGAYYYWWLRSSHGSNIYFVLSVSHSGFVSSTNAYVNGGVSPCFSLKR